MIHTSVDQEALVDQSSQPENATVVGCCQSCCICVSALTTHACTAHHRLHTNTVQCQSLNHWRHMHARRITGYIQTPTDYSSMSITQSLTTHACTAHHQLHTNTNRLQFNVNQSIIDDTCMHGTSPATYKHQQTTVQWQSLNHWRHMHARHITSYIQTPTDYSPMSITQSLTTTHACTAHHQLHTQWTIKNVTFYFWL